MLPPSCRKGALSVIVVKGLPKSFYPHQRFAYDGNVLLVQILLRAYLLQNQVEVFLQLYTTSIVKVTLFASFQP